MNRPKTDKPMRHSVPQDHLTPITDTDKESTTTAIFEYSKYKTFKTVQRSEEVRWALTGWGDGS